MIKCVTQITKILTEQVIFFKLHNISNILSTNTYMQILDVNSISSNKLLRLIYAYMCILGRQSFLAFIFKVQNTGVTKYVVR